MWGCTDTGREPQDCQISCFTPLLLLVQISFPKSRICTVQIAQALKVKLGICDIKKNGVDKREEDAERRWEASAAVHKCSLITPTHSLFSRLEKSLHFEKLQTSFEAELKRRERSEASKNKNNNKRHSSSFHQSIPAHTTHLSLFPPTPSLALGEPSPCLLKINIKKLFPPPPLGSRLQINQSAAKQDGRDGGETGVKMRQLYF